MGFNFKKFFGMQPSRQPDLNAAARQDELSQNYNINGAFGGRSFTKDPVTGRTIVNIDETPFQQSLRGNQQNIINKMYSSLLGEDDYNLQAEEVGDALYQRGMNKLQPGFDRDQTRLETNLSNRGIPIGSAAWADAFDQFGRNKSEQLNNLALDSTLARGQEQDRLARLLGGLGGESGQLSNAFADLLSGQPYQSNNVGNQSTMYNNRVNNRRYTQGMVGDLVGGGAKLIAGLL